MALLLNQLKHRIVLRYGGKRFRRRARRHREVALHRGLEAIEIFLQMARPVGVGNGAQPKALAEAALLERDFSGGLGVAHLLGASARRNQKSLALHLQQVDRGGVQFAALAPAHLQQVVVPQSQAESDQEAEAAVENALYRRRLMEGGRADVGAHTPIVEARRLTSRSETVTATHKMVLHKMVFDFTLPRC